MSDDISFFALMDSHLSRTTIEDENNTARSTSDMLLPPSSGPRLVIPNFFPGSSPMKDFLAEQISNTLKAKEKQKEAEGEQRKIEEEMKNLKIREQQQLSEIDNLAKIQLNLEQEYVIDLTPAIIHNPKPHQTKVQPTVTDETLLKSQRLKPAKLRSNLPLRWDKNRCLYKPWNHHLPCTTDISYILKQKIKKGKCSSFGKVLCSRVRSVRHSVVPYEIQKFNDSNILRFDFESKSPCDIYRENQRKPKMSTRWTVDILDYI